MARGSRRYGGGAAAAAAAARAGGERWRPYVTAVVPICENRISDASMLPGDVITSFSGQTIEILNADAEGRLILADALAWAAEKEGCTHLVDIATLTGAIWSMLGFVTTGVMASDDGFYDCLTRAAARSGEKFWRMPDDAEYEKLIESDYADVRNTSKDGAWRDHGRAVPEKIHGQTALAASGHRRDGRQYRHRLAASGPRRDRDCRQYALSSFPGAF